MMSKLKLYHPAQEDNDEEEGLQVATLEALPLVAATLGTAAFKPLWQRFAEAGAIRLCQPAQPSSLRLVAIGT